MLRLEYGDRITVTSVYPGHIRTSIHVRSVAAGVPLEGGHLSAGLGRELGERLRAR